MFGHKHIMIFKDDGIYWCFSAGPYDCVCERCNNRWETSAQGFLALTQSKIKDPRIKNRK